MKRGLCSDQLRFTKGLQYMVWATFFFSLMTLLVKFTARRLPATELVLARSVVGVVLGAWMVRAAGVNLWGQRKDLLVFRGMAGTGALICFFLALARLPLAEATVLMYTAPVFTAVLAAVFLRERLSMSAASGLLLSLAGVALVAQPGFLFGAASQGHDLGAVALCVMGAFLGGCGYVTVRKLRTTEHHLVVVFYFPLVSVAICLPLAAPVWVMPTPWEWLLLLGIGVFTQVAQIFLTRSLNLEAAARAMSVSYIQILFASLWGVWFLAEVPNVLTGAGALLVFAGTAVATRQP